MMKFTPRRMRTYRDRESVGIYYLEADGTCGPQVANMTMETIEVDSEAEAFDFAESEATLLASATDLLEMLDNVTASLETVLAHYGADMPDGDRRVRSQTAIEARTMVDCLRPCVEEGGAS